MIAASQRRATSAPRARLFSGATPAAAAVTGADAPWRTRPRDFSRNRGHRTPFERERTAYAAEVSALRIQYAREHRASMRDNSAELEATRVEHAAARAASQERRLARRAKSGAELEQFQEWYGGYKERKRETADARAVAAQDARYEEQKEALAVLAEVSESWIEQEDAEEAISDALNSPVQN